MYLIYFKKKQLHLPVTTEELKPPQLSPDSSKHKCCVATTRVLPLLANQDIHSRKSLQKNENKGNLHDFSMSFLNWRYDFLFCFVLSATLTTLLSIQLKELGLFPALSLFIQGFFNINMNFKVASLLYIYNFIFYFFSLSFSIE